MLHKTPIKERAKGRWRGILTALGVAESYLKDRHGPCPACGGVDRFRWDNRDGTGSFYCGQQCGSGDGVKLLQLIHGWDFKQTVKAIEGVIESAPVMPQKKPQSDEAKREAMRQVWRDSRPVEAGDLVTKYLKNRGIEWTPEIQNLRFCERLAYYHGEGLVSHHPAMLAVVQSKSGEPVNLHRTYLSLDGLKASVPTKRKLMAGEEERGSAVRLFKHETLLGIAEGIETALAAAALNPAVPVWAALNAGRMETWWPPKGVTSVVVYADNDEKYAGQKAAYALAHKLACQGIWATVRTPALAKTDWNDVLLRQRRPA